MFIHMKLDNLGSYMFPKEILVYCIELSNIKELIYGTLFMIKSVRVVEFPFTKSV